MIIYADILVLTNLYIDFFLILLVRKILQLDISGRRAVLGAAVGALSSLLLLAGPENNWLQLFFSAISALIVSLSLLVPSAPKACLKLACGLFIAGFLLAGLCLFLLRLLPFNKISVISGRLYFDVSPALLFFVTLFAYVILSVLRKFSGPPERQARFMRLTATDGCNTAELLAKADTGNSLTEPFSGLPVIVAEKSAVKDIFPKHDFLGQQASSQSAAEAAADCGLRLVSFSSLGGNGMLAAFRPQSLFLSKSHTEIKAYIAVYDGKLSNGQFNAVFNPDKFPKT